MNEAKNKVKNALTEQKKIYFIIIGVMLVGILLGIVFSLILSTSDHTLVKESLNTFFTDIKNNDINYEIDVSQMRKIRVMEIPNDKYYWLASRQVFNRYDGTYFRMRYVNKYGSECEDQNICGVNTAGSLTSYSTTYGLRPVFHLKSNIKVTGGSGTEEDPYTLGV